MSILAPPLCSAAPGALFSLATTGGSAPLHRLAAGAASQAAGATPQAATQPTNGGNLTVEVIVLLAALALAAVVAAATGVFKPRQVDGPLRVGPGRPVWPLAVALGAGLFVMFGSASLYFAVKQRGQTRGVAATHPASEPTTRAVPAELTLVDNAVLNTIPGILAFVFLVYVDRRMSGPLELRLGFTARRFPDGVAKGLLALVIVMPLMYAASSVTELVYHYTGYHHASEHVLLKLIGESPSPLLRWWLIGGALVTAPFFEEYVFRGLLQTLLRETFVRWSAGSRAPGGGPALPGFQAALAPPPPPDWRNATAAAETMASPGPAGATLDYFPRPEAAALVPPAGTRVWQTWAAIVLTSAAFAAIHEPWTAPLIFLLSLCLGYAYERTGSLWTSITIHLLFNATSTALYLWQHLR